MTSGKSWMKILHLVMIIVLVFILSGCSNKTTATHTDLIPSHGNDWYLLGINYPWINYGHDFGTTAWGHDGVSAVLAGWWQTQTSGDSQGITKVEQSSEQAYTGGNSLKLMTSLIGDDSKISKGEAFVDLRYHAPTGVEVPANLDGFTLSCWIYAPKGSGGDPNLPNGLQIFVKDDSWRSEYGTWVNIKEGQWNKVSLTPSQEMPYNGWMDNSFDPTRIVMVGVKVAIGTDSNANFEGAFYMDSFRFNNQVWFDFENQSVAEQDFKQMASSGIRVVRWFVFADGRAAPEFDDNGMVVGFDDFFYDDMDAALKAAQENGIKVILVLFDFHLCDPATINDKVQIGGHADLITNLEKRQSFINNALNPLLSRYGGNPNILAWEVMNEPEWAMTIEGGGTVGQPVSKEAMQGFVSDIAQYIKEKSKDLVTLGSASRKWLDLWMHSGLDFYQYHYYDKFEQETPFDIPYEELNLDKPCILGEFPTQSSNITVKTYLDESWTNNLAGALGWSFRAGDEYSQFSVAPFVEWRQTHPDAPVDIK